MSQIAKYQQEICCDQRTDRGPVVAQHCKQRKALVAEHDCSQLDSVRNFKFTQDESKIARHAFPLHSFRGRQGGRQQPQECRRGGRQPKLAHSSAALPARCRLSPSIVIIIIIQIKNLKSKIINHIKHQHKDELLQSLLDWHSGSQVTFVTIREN